MPKFTKIQKTEAPAPQSLTRRGTPRQRAPRKVHQDIQDAANAVIEAKQYLADLRKQHAEANQNKAAVRAATKLAKLQAKVAAAEAELAAAQL